MPLLPARHLASISARAARRPHPAIAHGIAVVARSYGGTAVQAMHPLLQERRKLTVVTNNLGTASDFLTARAWT